MNSPAPQRRLLKWLTIGSVLASGLVLTAWLAFPIWAHLLFSAVLPNGWKLIALETGRPGLRMLPIERLELEASLPWFELKVEAREISARLDGSHIIIDQLDARLAPANRPARIVRDGEQNFIERWSLPRVVPPGGLPRIEIGRLEWSLCQRDDCQPVVFDNLQFGQDTSSLTLETTLNPIPFMTRPGKLTTHLSEEGGYLDLLTEEENARRVFFYRQARVGGSTGPAGGEALATLQLDVDLAELDTDAILPFIEPYTMGSLERAEGTLRAALQFQGRERLQPLAFSLEADAVDLATGAESARLELSLNGGLDGTSILVDMERLDTRILLNPERWERIRSVITSRLGLSGLPDSTAILGIASNEPGRVRIDIDQGTPVEWKGAIKLEAQAGSSRGSLAATDGSLSSGPDGSPVFDGRFEATLQHPESLRLEQDVIQIDLDDLDLALMARIRLDQSGLHVENGQLIRFTAAKAHLTAEDLELKVQNAELPGRFGWGESNFFEGSLRATDLVADEPGISPSLLRSASVSGSIGLSLTGSPEIAGRLRFDGATMPSMDVSMDGLDLEIKRLDVARLDGQVALLTTGMRVPFFDRETTGFDLDLDSEIRAGEPLQGNGELLIGYSAALPFSFRTRDESGHLVVDLERSALPASALPNLLRTLEPAWADPFKSREGELILDGSIDLLEVGDGLVPSGVLKVDSDGLAFCYGKTCIRDLDLHGSWLLGSEISGATSLSIGHAGLAAGLDLLSFRTQIDVKNMQRIELNDFAARLLDGHLQSSPIIIADQSLRDATLSWSGFDLANLFTFLDVSGLAGSGRIDAELPIVNTAGQYGIANGHFNATGPGTIRYRSGSPAVNIGMQSLENFHFDALDGTIDYRPDGRYDIRVTLNGRNPDLYGGHPVRFNLNIGGELPALFRTLFITGDFGQAILDQIKADSDGNTVPGR